MPTLTMVAKAAAAGMGDASTMAQTLTTVLNAYHRLCYSPGGFQQWWCRLRGSDDELDNAHLVEVIDMRFGSPLAPGFMAKAVVDAAGVGCEPASAASVAGVQQLIRDGTIRGTDRVVAVLTGHILKDPMTVTFYHQEREPPPPRANRPVEIEPTLSEIERELRACLTT